MVPGGLDSSSKYWGSRTGTQEGLNGRQGDSPWFGLRHVPESENGALHVSDSILALPSSATP